MQNTCGVWLKVVTKQVGIFVTNYYEIKSIAQKLSDSRNIPDWLSVCIVYPNHLAELGKIDNNVCGIDAWQLDNPAIAELDAILLFEKMEMTENLVEFLKLNTIDSPVIGTPSLSAEDKVRFSSGSSFIGNYAFKEKFESVLIVSNYDLQLLRNSIPITNLSETVLRLCFYAKNNSSLGIIGSIENPKRALPVLKLSTFLHKAAALRTFRNHRDFWNADVLPLGNFANFGQDKTPKTRFEKLISNLPGSKRIIRILIFKAVRYKRNISWRQLLLASVIMRFVSIFRTQILFFFHRKSNISLESVAQNIENPKSKFFEILSMQSEPILEEELVEIAKRKSILNPEVVKGIQKLAVSKLNVLAFAHDYFSENVGGIQTCMSLEHGHLESKGGDYWTIFPQKFSLGLQTSPNLILTNGEEIIGDFLGCQLPEVLHLLEGMVILNEGSLIIEIHSLLGHDPGIIQGAISQLMLKDFYFYLHDFYSICPSLKLMRNGHTFCGGPESNSISCRVCFFGDVRKVHEARISALVELPEMKLIAPSLAAKDVWLTSTKSNKPVEVIPHISLHPLQNRGWKEGRRRRIGYVGNPVAEKGWDKFLLLIERFHTKYEFILFSKDDPRIENCRFVPLVNKSRDTEFTKKILLDNEVDCVLIYPNWPETFSLVTVEAISAGAYVITNYDSGNVQSLVSTYGAGMIAHDFGEVVSFLENENNFPTSTTIYEARLTGLYTALPLVGIK